LRARALRAQGKRKKAKVKSKKAKNLIEVRVDDAEIRRELGRLAARLANLRPFYKNVGEELVQSTQERFNAQQDPEGHPWKKDLPGTWARKKTKRILRESGQLQDTIHYQADGDKVMIGSSKVYAAIHQFGGKTAAHTIRPKRKKALFWPGAAHPMKSVRHPGSRIPARPFLGVSERDKTRILEIAADFLAKA
jgi:phage virion morphogenesis protein